MHLIIFTDGGSRGNPGPAASGVYITDDHNNKIAEIGKTLGITTNNVAEYTAVVIALDWLLPYYQQHPELSRVSFFMDSLLVCSQVTGKWRIKDPTLSRLAATIHQKLPRFPFPITFTHVPRAQNKQADRMVNWALDQQIKA